MTSTSTNAAATKSILTPSITLRGHGNRIQSISYFPDGQRMISGSEDKTARQWDLKAGKEIEEARSVCEGNAYVLAVSRDGRWVVTGGERVELKAYEAEMAIVKTFNLKGHSNWINCIDISADNTRLASGSDDTTARIWNLDTGKLVAGPFKSIGGVGAVRFSPDSKKLAVKSNTGQYLEVWDVQSQKLDVKVGEYGQLLVTHSPVFWTNNKTIIAAFTFTNDVITTIYEFDGSTLEIVGTPFEGHTYHISSLALSSDDALLASASYDNTIKLWAFESRQLLASFDVRNLLRLVLSPTSRQLAYTVRTTYDYKICICDIPPDVLAQARNIARKKSNLDHLLHVRLPSHSLPPPPIDGHAGTSRIQPTDIRPLTNKRQWPTLIPPSQIPSSTVGSRLPQLSLDLREHLPSSSHMHSVFSARSDKPDDLPTEPILQDLSTQITKDGDYPVARGGFGEIWKCTFHVDRRSVKVAVKALQVYAADQLGASKAKKIQRIKRELRICAKLKHANILPVYGYTYGFGPFLAIVSPWAENGNLSDYLELKGAALTLVRRFGILKDIIAGLQYLHTNSIIHGDFNGPNVLIHGDGTACVADFGLSLMYSDVISPSQASWTSTLKGNMRWMAPELLVLEREDGSPTRPSEQSDIFSFGGIMLQVLTNKIPYYYLPNDAAIVLCIAKSEKPFRSRYPDLPEKYWPFIEQCWSTDPRDRPSTEGADVTIRNEFYALSRFR